MKEHGYTWLDDGFVMSPSGLIHQVRGLQDVMDLAALSACGQLEATVKRPAVKIARTEDEDTLELEAVHG